MSNDGMMQWWAQSGAQEEAEAESETEADKVFELGAGDPF